MKKLVFVLLCSLQAILFNNGMQKEDLRLIKSRTFSTNEYYDFRPTIAIRKNQPGILKNHLTPSANHLNKQEYLDINKEEPLLCQTFKELIKQQVKKNRFFILAVVSSEISQSTTTNSKLYEHSYYEATGLNKHLFQHSLFGPYYTYNLVDNPDKAFLEPYTRNRIINIEYFFIDGKNQGKNISIENSFHFFCSSHHLSTKSRNKKEAEASFFANAYTYFIPKLMHHLNAEKILTDYYYSHNNLTRAKRYCKNLFFDHESHVQSVLESKELPAFQKSTILNFLNFIRSPNGLKLIDIYNKLRNTRPYKEIDYVLKMLSIAKTIKEIPPWTIVNGYKSLYEGTDDNKYRKDICTYLESIRFNQMPQTKRNEIQEILKNVIKFCAICIKPSLTLRLCTLCDKGFYCSQECQKKDWRKHKPTCQKESYKKMQPILDPLHYQIARHVLKPFASKRKTP